MTSLIQLVSVFVQVHSTYTAGCDELLPGRCMYLEVIHECPYQHGGEAVLSHVYKSGHLLWSMLLALQSPAPPIFLDPSLKDRIRLCQAPEHAQTVPARFTWRLTRPHGEPQVPQTLTRLRVNTAQIRSVLGMGWEIVEELACNHYCRPPPGVESLEYASSPR
jgi:hypothetical protein